MTIFILEITLREKRNCIKGEQLTVYINFGG
jgi:hypothetical protein